MVLARFATVFLSAALLSSGLSTCRGSADAPATTSSAGGTAAPATVADVDLPGVDTSSLTPRERREWSQFVSEMIAPCSDTPVPIAQCVKEKRSCAKCGPAAQFLVKEVRDGRTREAAMEAYRSRFDDSRAKNIDLSATPMRGPATAPVAVVEWADFECPFCKRAAPVLDQLVDKFQGKVRLYFKVYPLSSHVHGEPAARAFIAALGEGKGWEMHDKLFANSPAGLEQSNFETYAKDLGLKLDAFKADMTSDATKQRIERDKKQAEALNFQGTPLIYINGREFESKGDFVNDLDEWVNFELELMGQPTVDVKKYVPPAASSAAPAASAPIEKK